MISAETLDNLKNKKVRVNLHNIHEVARIYKELDEVIELCKAKKETLEPVLKAKRVYEVFSDDGKKVIYVEGKNQTYLDTDIIVDSLTLDEIKKSASFTEKKLKEIDKEELAVRARKTKEEKTKDSVKVSSMTKKELKEINEKKLPKGVL